MTFVIIPGLDGSDEQHWQTHWESGWLADAVRIQPSSWTSPDLADWSDAITRAVENASGDIVFVTHSLGCHALAHWLAAGPNSRVRGAFVVAPPDPLAPTFPVERMPSFGSLPVRALGVPAVLIASTDDPYCTVDAAARLAAGWATPLITLARLGHINSLGRWPQGRSLFTAYLAGLNLVPDQT
ncbi:RBBP9/YdeN family alpha/beta hydrolase [Kribbella sp. NPDC004875]|uniref:RBBP9/YdeN family alpha/beta hydrolase n=1 Tax=Kribbella sp. NPDC004875 TaxID=3364107 RepID=UPI00367DF27C